jgi:hypothetical protein
MKRLAAIRNAKDWRDRLTLAANKQPGTEFDWLFTEARLAVFLNDDRRTKAEGAARLARMGLYFSQLFQRGDSRSLRQLAAALYTWHRHEPRRKIADVIRMTLVGLNGMFPPGKPRLKHVGKKLVKQGTWSKVSVRDVIQSVKRKGFVKDNTNMDALRRKIQSEAKMLNIELDHKPGSPGQKLT